VFKSVSFLRSNIARIERRPEIASGGREAATAGEARGEPLTGGPHLSGQTKNRAETVLALILGRD
jgi:hypothetical protein